MKFYSTGKKEGSRHEAEIDKVLEKYNIHDKVKFLGYLSESEIKEYLSTAQFVVINKLTTLQNQYCFSTKLGEYMAASKAVIITNVGEAMNWLTHEKDAYIIPPNDISALSEAMQKLFKDHELCKELGMNAQKTCLKSFSIDSNTEKLKDFVYKLAGLGQDTIRNR